MILYMISFFFVQMSSVPISLKVQMNHLIECKPHRFYSPRSIGCGARKWVQMNAVWSLATWPLKIFGRCCYGWWFQIFFISTPTREMIQFDGCIFFQMGWWKTTNWPCLLSLGNDGFLNFSWVPLKRKKMVGYNQLQAAGVLGPSKSWFAGNVLFFSHVIWVFPKNNATPKSSISIWMVYSGRPGTLLKWMIWGYPYFWKHPYGEAAMVKDGATFFPNSSWWEKALLNYERWN